MAARTTSAKVGFVSATPTSLADELLDRLIAFRPIDTRAIHTKVGTSQATIAEVVVIDETGHAESIGVRAIFWQIVRRQLAKATPENPWVVGRLVQTGQAYRLEPIEGQDEPRVQAALNALAPVNA